MTEQVNLISKEGWVILTNLTSKDAATATHRERFDVEVIFRDFKSGGYNLENTNVSDNRLMSLILLIDIAYISATFKEQIIKQKGVQSYVDRIKEYGRISRKHSSFYVGLYGQSWVRFMESCWVLVAKLMRLNPNKIEYYLRG